MINTNELRRGNHIGFSVSNGKDHVSGRGIITAIGEKDVRLNDVVFPVDTIKPIPLTPEILEQCGFQKDGHRWKIEPLFFLEIQEHGSWVNGEPVSEIKYMVYKSHIGAIKEVKYLHKLQNLYYEVMDSDLQINFKELTPH